MADIPAFQDWRLDAAREFAQTMIVIDDEASQSEQPAEVPPVGKLEPPSRNTLAAPRSIEPGATVPKAHSLNAKALIDEAMDLGLICSVLRPTENENFQNRVVNAAKNSDIVCLDWEIYDDAGDAASEIISAILQSDAEQNGRLRLIAIYTGDTTNNVILDKILEKIPKELIEKHQFKKDPLAIESTRGVKIVCLFKSHAIKLSPPRDANQISETELPKRLQAEFASLSEGLLSNVALGTIAAIRNSTHHVLSKFIGAMDGPYFHHRACIVTPEEAEEYAVDIVLSELKSVIDKQGVATKNAGENAIQARVKEIANGASTLTLRYLDRGKPATYDVPEGLASRMVVDGITPVLKSNAPTGSPGKKRFTGEFSTLFARNLDEAHSMMHQFAVLTSVRAHPLSHVFKTGDRFPTLGLGTILEGVEDKDQRKTYLLCLQASCDSVRIESSTGFLFVPLELRETDPEHVVPNTDAEDNDEWIGLAVSNAAYTMAKSIEFAADSDTKTIMAKQNTENHSWYFEDIEGNTYPWIADLKRRRALRAAQRLGQQVGRLGFDEFEPYRQNSDRITP